MLEVRIVVEGDGLFGQWQMSRSQAGNGVFVREKTLWI